MTTTFQRNWRDEPESIWRCATGDSDVSGPGPCPPVVEYSREYEAQAAEEADLLPEGSAIVEMLSDYAVMREQARAARR
ncbi:hypothetical protein ABIE58_003781 [Roseovarius sp. MBR-78]|jgi:hypothetical protein|uniref:hypothetical protein n=1 Tax=Roseovarius sp. MBR-78 TaxID=3156460 RepID=UPI00339642F8